MLESGSKKSGGYAGQALHPNRPQRVPERLYEHQNVRSRPSKPDFSTQQKPKFASRFRTNSYVFTEKLSAKGESQKHDERINRKVRYFARIGESV